MCGSGSLHISLLASLKCTYCYNFPSAGPATVYKRCKQWRQPFRIAGRSTSQQCMGAERSNYCQFHTSCRPMKSQLSHFTAPIKCLNYAITITYSAKQSEPTALYAQIELQLQPTKAHTRSLSAHSLELPDTEPDCVALRRPLPTTFDSLGCQCHCGNHQTQ